MIIPSGGIVTVLPLFFYGKEEGSLYRHHILVANLIATLFIGAGVDDNPIAAQGGEIALNRTLGDFSAKSVIEERRVAPRVFPNGLENAVLSVAQHDDGLDFTDFRLALRLHVLGKMLVKDHFVNAFKGPQGVGNHLLAVGKRFCNGDYLIRCAMNPGGVVNLLNIDDGVNGNGNLPLVRGGKLHRLVFQHRGPLFRLERLLLQSI